MTQETSKNNYTDLLRDAIECDDIERFKSLIEQKLKDIDDSVDEPPVLGNPTKLLLEGISSGDTKWCKRMIKAGARVDEQDEFGETALHIAARCGFVDICELLLEHGLEIDVRSERRCTPLHSAARSGKFKTFKFLVEHGADVNAQSEHGDTPLHEAAAAGSVEICKMLLDHGVDVNVKDAYGFPPLHAAMVLARTTTQDFLRAHGGVIEEWMTPSGKGVEEWHKEDKNTEK